VQQFLQKLHAQAAVCYETFGQFHVEHPFYIGSKLNHSTSRMSSSSI
jgi:hypothetical protein